MTDAFRQIFQYFIYPPPQKKNPEKLYPTFNTSPRCIRIAGGLPSYPPPLLYTYIIQSARILLQSDEVLFQVKTRYTESFQICHLIAQYNVIYLYYSVIYRRQMHGASRGKVILAILEIQFPSNYELKAKKKNICENGYVFFFFIV